MEERRLKRNCRIYKATELWDETHSRETRIPVSVLIRENGDLWWRFADGSHGSLTANECAYRLDMPLWELVTVDELGADEYALLLFEH